MVLFIKFTDSKNFGKIADILKWKDHYQLDLGMPKQWAESLNKYKGIEVDIYIRLAAAAATKLLHLCLMLCDPMDYSPPGSSVMGFSRQEYWGGVPCPSPGILLIQGHKACPVLIYNTVSKRYGLGGYLIPIHVVLLQFTMNSCSGRGSWPKSGQLKYNNPLQQWWIGSEIGMWPISGQTEIWNFFFLTGIHDNVSWKIERPITWNMKVKPIHRKQNWVMTFGDHIWVLNQARWEDWYTNAFFLVMCANMGLLLLLIFLFLIIKLFIPELLLLKI